MKKISIYSSGVIILVLLGGCASTGKNLPHGLQSKGAISVTTVGQQQYLDKWSQWANDSLEKLKIYIGKTKDDLRKDFGDPTYVLKNVVISRKNYEEEWRYDYADGVPFITYSSWSYFFYMNNGMVEYVEAF